MPWFKVDDALHDHRKARIAGAHAMGLWVLAGSWCGANPNDGFIPQSVVIRWEPKAYKKLAQRLVDAELWDVDELDGEAGWRFHDWGHFQPTKAEIEAEKAAARARMKSRRARLKGVGSDGVRPNTSGTDDEPTTGVRAVFEDPEPDRPVPSRTETGEEPSSTIADAITDATTLDDPRPDVEELCTHLADRIEQNGSKRPTITKAWRDAARLMLDKDHRPFEQALAGIDWCQNDEFWRSNVLSMPTFREKYDQLRLSAKRLKDSTSKPSTTDARVAEGIALAQRLREQEQAAGSGPIYLDGPQSTPAIGATA